MTQRPGGSSPTRSAAPKTVAEAEAILRDMAAASAAFGETFGGESARIGPGTDGRYRSLVEQIPAVTFMASLEGEHRELYVSPQIEALLGFTQEEWLSDPVLWYWQLHPDDRDRCTDEFARGCLTGGPFRAEFRALTRKGEVVWVRGEASLVRDADGRSLYLQGIAYDITETKLAEDAVRQSTEKLRVSLREKEVLLQEIHHRVKNNLQVISSLLRLQSSRVTDPAALEFLTVSQNRVHSMALVHERLYRSGDLSRIEFDDYVRTLSALLVRSYGLDSTRVTLRMDLEEAHLGVETAIPLGLIVNELFSNCLKHAFPTGRSGEVRIALKYEGPAGCQLSISDDGVGLPAGFDPRRGTGLGMQLVYGLAAQIGGSVDLEAGERTTFRITFPLEHPGTPQST